MNFTKMQGCGNDYIYINGIENPIPSPSELAVKMSDRNFGVGSDGLVLILPSEVADFTMRMFNSDGSEAEMCGNAIRCVGKYVYDKGLIGKTNITIDTLAGIKVLEMTLEQGKVAYVTVDMGEPILKAEKIPVLSDYNPVVSQTVTADQEYLVTCVSMGNPHAVLFVKDVKDCSLEKVGPLLETHSVFPRKTNVEFVEPVNRELVNMRVWERGAGETLACGTGACATLVACVLNDKTERRATIHLLGGDLVVEWDKSTNHVFMTGPAVLVFEGQWA